MEGGFAPVLNFPSSAAFPDKPLFLNSYRTFVLDPMNACLRHAQEPNHLTNEQCYYPLQTISISDVWADRQKPYFSPTGTIPIDRWVEDFSKFQTQH